MQRTIRTWVEMVVEEEGEDVNRRKEWKRVREKNIMGIVGEKVEIERVVDMILKKGENGRK